MDFQPDFPGSGSPELFSVFFFTIILMLRKEFSAILTLQKKAIIKERKNVGKDGGLF